MNNFRKMIFFSTTTTTTTTTTTRQEVPVGSTYTYEMTVNGSAGLSVIVEFEKVSTDTINMTSTLTCPAPDLFTDARCGDHRTHFSCLFLTVL